MELTMEKRELVKALAATSSSLVSSKMSSLPILSHVKIEASGVGVTFMTTDLEVATTFYVTTLLEREGVCTTEHKALLALAKKLPDGLVTLGYNDGTLTVSAGKTTIPLEATNASDYPNIPTVEGDEMVVDVAEFGKIVKNVLPAAAEDDARPVLTGILLRWRNDVLTCVGADGFHMALDCMMLPGSWPFAPLVPARCLKLAIKRLAKEGKLTITCPPKRSQISFECGQVRVTSRLIEGTYPDYMFIVPKDDEIKTASLVHTQALVEALDATYPIAKEASNITPFHIYETGKLTVEAQKDGMEKPMIVEIEGSTNGSEQEIVLNNRYAHGLLNALSEPEVLLEFDKPTTPCKITVPTRPGYLGVIMSMNIRNR